MRAAVEPGSTREQTVAVADLADILVSAACGDDCSGAALFPDVDIFLCVESNNPFAGSAGGRLDSYAVFKVCAQKTIGISFP